MQPYPYDIMESQTRHICPKPNLNDHKDLQLGLGQLLIGASEGY